MRISDWSSDVRSSDLGDEHGQDDADAAAARGRHDVAATFARVVEQVAPQRVAARLECPGQADDGQQQQPCGQRQDGQGPGVRPQIGSVSCRERVCQYVKISGVALSLKIKQYIYNLQLSTVPTNPQQITL